MDGSRAASIDLPAPGGPIINRLWPPAAATSSARLALSWPLMSARSSGTPSSSRIFGCGRLSTCVPLKWLASWMSDCAATISISGEAQAASGPQAAGQISPCPRALAPIAAGSTPATGRCAPSRPSSPSTVKPAMASGGMRADRGHQAERDRQVVMAAFLGQVGGREIDGDAAGRQRQAGGDQRRAHPLLGFRHRLVGQADDVEGRQAGRDLHLHVDGAGLDALERHGGDALDHGDAPQPATRQSSGSWG